MTNPPSHSISKDPSPRGLPVRKLAQALVQCINRTYVRYDVIIGCEILVQ